MKEIDCKIGSPCSFSDVEIATFLKLLIKQDKVHDPSKEKILRCKYLGMALLDKKIVSIGSVKPKTVSDFQAHKADLSSFSGLFDWEIGYFFTESEHEGNRYSSNIFDGLLRKFGNGKLMASTEIREGNRMINSLENRGFKQCGKSWISTKSGNTLRLFLRD